MSHMNFHPARTNRTRPTIGGPTDPSTPATPQGRSGRPFTHVRDDAGTPVEHSPENGPFDGRRDTGRRGLHPSSPGPGGLPNLNDDDQFNSADGWLLLIALGLACWIAGILYAAGVVSFDLLVGTCGCFGIAIISIALLGAFERLFPNADILGHDLAGKDERLACHTLYRPTGTVEASPVDAPIRKCSKCRDAVFLSGLCPYHFELYTDMAYDTSWERDDTF